MIIKHKFRFTRLCPVDDGVDNYKCHIETNKIIKVETILATIDALPKKAFQESITQTLARKLGCRVKTTCYHSGVKTICECS